MQKTILTGRLGRDAAKREHNGRSFVSFTMVDNEFFRGEEKAYWYDVMAFNVSDNVFNTLKKGSFVVVSGFVDTDLEVGTDSITRLRRSMYADTVGFDSNTSRSTDGTRPSETTQASTPVAAPASAPVAEPVAEPAAAPVEKATTRKATKVATTTYFDEGNNDDIPF